MNHFDVIVIGSGPGGYVCAIRCAQLGLKTALVEKYNTLGGTCLNVGCIPSKSLLDSSHHFEMAKKHFSDHGIEISGELTANLSKMIERKNAVVQQTCSGIKFLMDKNKITVFFGTASLINKHSIKVQLPDNEHTITGEHIVIATGSKPSEIPSIGIDEKRIITSTQALNLKEIPKHLIVVGGGVIGLELGTVYHRLGAEVSVVEYADSILPTMDQSLSKELTKILKKKGIRFYTNHKVQSVENQSNSVKLTAIDKNQNTVTLTGDYCLVAVGRRPYTSGLNLEALGIPTDDKGRIIVNEKLQTSIPSIYAIGDVIQGAMLAHKAEEEGVFVAETIAGQKPHIDYNLIPSVVYTWPEVASVGKTEQALKAENTPYKVGTFPLKALGRARASMDTDGFVKVIAHKETDEILGVHIIAARAADLIAEATIAMEYKASAEDITRISHAHPTFCEAIKEAALAATENRAIHI